MMFLRKYFCFSPKMYNLDGDKDLMVCLLYG